MHFPDPDIAADAAEFAANADLVSALIEFSVQETEVDRLSQERAARKSLVERI